MVCVFQTGDEGDGVEVLVSSEGSLVLTLTRNDHPHTLSLGRDLNDNTWHRFYLRFALLHIYSCPRKEYQLFSLLITPQASSYMSGNRLHI